MIKYYSKGGLMNYLINTWFGVFVVDEDINILEKTLYPKDVEKLVKKNLKQKEGIENLKMNLMI